MDKSPRSYNSHPCEVEMLISGEYKTSEAATKTWETINFAAHCSGICDMACICGPLQHSSFFSSQ